MNKPSQECNNWLWFLVNVGRLIWREWKIIKKSWRKSNHEWQLARTSLSRCRRYTTWNSNLFFSKQFNIFQWLHHMHIPNAFRKMPRIMLNADIRILWNKQVWMKISWDQRENQVRPTTWTMTLWMRIITALKAKPRRGMETHEWWEFKISVFIFFLQWICVMIITEQNKSVQCRDLTVC